MADERDPRRSPRMQANGRTARERVRQDGTPAFSVQDELRRDRSLRRAGRYRRARRRTAPLAAILASLLLCFALLGGAGFIIYIIYTVIQGG